MLLPCALYDSLFCQHVSLLSFFPSWSHPFIAGSLQQKIRSSSDRAVLMLTYADMEEVVRHIQYSQMCSPTWLAIFGGLKLQTGSLWNANADALPQPEPWLVNLKDTPESMHRIYSRHTLNLKTSAFMSPSYWVVVSPLQRPRPHEQSPLFPLPYVPFVRFEVHQRVTVA